MPSTLLDSGHTVNRCARLGAPGWPALGSILISDVGPGFSPAYADLKVGATFKLLAARRLENRHPKYGFLWDGLRDRIPFHMVRARFQRPMEITRQCRSNAMSDSKCVDSKMLCEANHHDIIP